MKVKLSIIEYSNTIPFVYGVFQSKSLLSQSDIIFQYPAQSALSLLNNEVDVSIVPIAAIPNIPNAQIVSNFCIASKQKVKSVKLFSNLPLSEIKTITLDYQSRTSNCLVQVLAKDFWGISPSFVMGTQGYEDESHTDAKVIIGNRALEMQDEYAYYWDLAEEWYKAFHLPFVFACWVANKPISAEYITELEDAFSFGVNHITDAVIDAKSNTTFLYNIEEYLQENLDFVLTEDKKESIQLFLDKTREL